MAKHDRLASLNRQVEQLYQQGKYEQAVPIAEEACEQDLRAQGEEHLGYAQSLNDLASLYRAMGNYAAAEPLCRQALDIRHKALGEHHPDYAASLNNLAELYCAMGNYAAAEPLYRQALEIDRKTVGENDPSYATDLNNLGGLYYSTGNYAAAEPFYRQASDILCRAPGEDHSDYAASLSGLALLYVAIGNYGAAEPLLHQALKVTRKALGEDHPDYAASLNNLALLYVAIGNYAAAEPLLHQALEITRKALGEDHPAYATSLGNLAALYHAMDNYAAAEPVYRHASDIFRRTLGEDHPAYATSLDNLAALYRAMGNYAAAEPLYHQALGIRRKVLGEDHPDYAESLNGLAWLSAATDRPVEALSLIQAAAAIDDHMIGQVFSAGAESQRLAYLAWLQGNLHAFLSLAFQYLSPSSEVVQAALDLVLHRKAIGAEAVAAQRDAVLGGRYPALQAQLQELTIWRRQIAQKTLAGPGPEGLEAHQRLLVEWTAHQERLEEILVPQIPEMNLEQKLRAADRQAVAQALPDNAALVELVRFDVFDFKAVPARGEAQWKPAHYLAFILPAGKPDNVQMKDLGEAQPIEQLIAGFRASITGGDRSLRPPEPQAAALPGDGAALRRALFDPLVPALAGRTRLFLAPDGDLSRLPFEALPTDDGRRLIDDCQLSYVGVGRDLLRFGAETLGQPAGPLVVADPDFDLGSEDAPPPAGDTGPHGRQSRALDPNALHFDPLPDTHEEGAHIAALLDVQPWLGGAALKGRLKAFPAPRILHIATHGFFLEDQQRDPNQQRLDVGMPGGMENSWLGRLTHAMENPLLRSGLALAGANTWLQDRPLPAEAEDGILTAEDVSGLDLIGTELVVLSACDTGLGEVQVGEGVLGLRRAFVLAGAKTLVMSLWKVPDQQTQELMENFYRRILASEPSADALRAAQLAMKAAHPEPLYWGAFICQGDPGPLSLASYPQEGKRWTATAI
jgi:CHAT domain-containing protein/tetratricopeptide (TPR) repeat protein